jgi:hypothetical protein
MLVKVEELREEEPELEQSPAGDAPEDATEPPETPAERPVVPPLADDTSSKAAALLDEIKALVPVLARIAAPEVESADAEDVITIPLAAEPDTPKAPEPDATKAAGPDIAELVKAAVTEASRASEERIKALEAELAKVQSLPVPGGPVLTRTAEDTQKAVQKDARLSEAAKFRALADQVTDPIARQGYLQLATAIDVELAK